MKSLYYSTWIFVNLGSILRIFETCPKRSLGTPEKLRVVSPEAHVSFQIGSGFKYFENLYYGTWIFVDLGAIFRIFETCPKRSIGSPEQLCVLSSEAHVSFQISSDF